MKVSVLLATYNGEKYISAQIDSLLKQSYSDFRIYINDDFSNDGTYSIIRKAALIDSRISVTRKKCGGSAQNFFYLISQHKTDDFIFLCDQDDIWLPNKIEVTLAEAMNYKTELPLLVYCDKAYVNEELQPLDIKPNRHNDDLRSLLCQNHIYGCTMLLNRALTDMLIYPETISSHDYWIALFAALTGTIVHIDQRLMLYRQHASNVTGGINQFGLWNKITRWNLVNSLMINTLHDEFKFCEYFKNMNNPTLNAFLKILYDRCPLSRILKARAFGYMKDNMFATIRAYFVLMKFKHEDLP